MRHTRTALLILIGLAGQPLSAQSTNAGPSLAETVSWINANMGSERKTFCRAEKRVAESVFRLAVEGDALIVTESLTYERSDGARGRTNNFTYKAKISGLTATPKLSGYSSEQWDCDGYLPPKPVLVIYLKCQASNCVTEESSTASEIRITTNSVEAAEALGRAFTHLLKAGGARKSLF
jgi:hypothetical protein